MKNLFVSAAIAATGLAFTATPAMAHPAPVQAEESAPAQKRVIKPRGRCDVLSEDTFRALKKGMTIDQIEHIVGCRGKEFVSVDVHNGIKRNYIFKGGRKTVLWIWTLNGFLDTKGGN